MGVIVVCLRDQRTRFDLYCLGQSCAAKSAVKERDPRSEFLF